MPMASYALQRHLGWRMQSRLGQFSSPQAKSNYKGQKSFHRSNTNAIVKALFTKICLKFLANFLRLDLTKLKLLSLQIQRQSNQLLEMILHILGCFDNCFVVKRTFSTRICFIFRINQLIYIFLTQYPQEEFQVALLGENWLGHF